MKKMKMAKNGKNSQFAKNMHRAMARKTIEHAKKILECGYEAKLPEAIVDKRFLRIPITKERAEELKRIIKEEEEEYLREQK